MERRKDNKGRVLKEGESQRKDGSYQYRYSDRSGKRHYIYSVDLKDLRSRETSIQKARTLYGDVVNTTITMRDVINRYFEMHIKDLCVLILESIVNLLSPNSKTMLFGTGRQIVLRSAMQSFGQKIYPIPDGHIKP